MATPLSEVLVETLARAGVKRILAVVDDSLDGVADAVRRHPELKWIAMSHEEVAAFAAGSQAHLPGNAGRCGPGNTHVPVLAIASHIPSSEIGSNYFQEIHRNSSSGSAVRSAN